jgi:hypothetical protein
VRRAIDRVGQGKSRPGFRPGERRNQHRRRHHGHRGQFQQTFCELDQGIGRNQTLPPLQRRDLGELRLDAVGRPDQSGLRQGRADPENREQQQGRRQQPADILNDVREAGLALGYAEADALRDFDEAQAISHQAGGGGRRQSRQREGAAHDCGPRANILRLRDLTALARLLQASGGRFFGLR